MATTKLCIKCFHKHFGEHAKLKVLTWSRACWDCGVPTPRLSTLIKADIIADMAKA